MSLTLHPRTQTLRLGHDHRARVASLTWKDSVVRRTRRKVWPCNIAALSSPLPDSTTEARVHGELQ